MKATLLAGLLILLLGPRSGPAAGAGLPEGLGAMLPLQDRVGDAQLAELTETLLWQELGARTSLAEAEEVRAVLRSLRVRDASNEPLDRLAVMADRLEADWFFVATLHEARRGRGTQRRDDGESTQERLEDRGQTPQVVLSARVFRRDSAELWWSGFNAASGRDRERAFGLGGIESLEELTKRAAQALVAEAAAPRSSPGRTRLGYKRGYLRAADRPSSPAKVAVVPMDSVAERSASGSAEVVTAALFAALDDFGFTALLPGLVLAIRQEYGQIQQGAASRTEWEALAREGGADWVATGMVETYRRGQGRDPDPWVAFSVRFLDTGDGSIDWLAGLERTGRDTASVFDRGRIYSTGDLTYEMMRALFGAMRSGSSVGKTPEGR